METRQTEGRRHRQRQARKQRDRYKERRQGEQGHGGLGPGLGVVWWAVVAGERVVWSGALDVGE